VWGVTPPFPSHEIRPRPAGLTEGTPFPRLKRPGRDARRLLSVAHARSTTPPAGPVEGHPGGRNLPEPPRHLRSRFALACTLLVVVHPGCGGPGTPEHARDRDALNRFIERSPVARHGRFGQIGNAYRTPAGRRDVTGVVAAYRPLGFFSGGGRDAAVARRVARILRREEGRRFRVRRRIDELAVLAADRARVDYDDTEVDALPGNQAYVDLLGRWSRISGGAFRFRDVRERWAAENGPVAITFTLRGRPRRVSAQGLDGFEDLCVLFALNRLLPAEAPHLALYEPFDQTAWVTAVTPGERRRLERDHGWRFATPATARRSFDFGRLYECGSASRCPPAG